MPSQLAAVLVDGERASYTIHGTGARLVLVHGFGIHSRIWHPMLDGLRHFSVVTLDLRGYGLNAHLPPPYHLDAQVTLLHQVIAHLGGADFLLGYSYGGRVVCEYVLRHHPRLQKALVVATPFVDAWWSRSLTRLFAALSRHPRLGGSAVWLGTHRPVSDVLVVVAGLASVANRAVIDRCMTLVRAEPNVTAILAGAADLFTPVPRTAPAAPTPVHFIYGDNDRLAPPRSTARIRHLFPRTEQLNLSGVHHLLPLEAPQLLTNVLLASCRPPTD